MGCFSGELFREQPTYMNKLFLNLFWVWVLFQGTWDWKNKTQFLQILEKNLASCVNVQSLKFKGYPLTILVESSLRQKSISMQQTYLQHVEGSQ